MLTDESKNDSVTVLSNKNKIKYLTVSFTKQNPLCFRLLTFRHPVKTSQLIYQGKKIGTQNAWNLCENKQTENIILVN